MDKDARLQRIEKLRAEGHSYQEIGDMLGISRQRVWQLTNAGRRAEEIAELAARQHHRDSLST